MRNAACRSRVRRVDEVCQDGRLPPGHRAGELRREGRCAQVHLRPQDPGKRKHTMIVLYGNQRHDIGL